MTETDAAAATGTPVRFTVEVEFDAPPREVWDQLVDWKGHEAWIPMTRVEVDGDDPTAIGSTFVAWSGPGPLALEDRMRVDTCTWSEDTRSGECEVAKLGPVLRGRAGFTVEPSGGGSTVAWLEDVTVPHLPRFLAPVAAFAGSIGFRFGMWRLGRLLR